MQPGLSMMELPNLANLFPFFNKHFNFLPLICRLYGDPCGILDELPGPTILTELIN